MLVDFFKSLREWYIVSNYIATVRRLGQLLHYRPSLGNTLDKNMLQVRDYLRFKELYESLGYRAIPMEAIRSYGRDKFDLTPYLKVKQGQAFDIPADKLDYYSLLAAAEKLVGSRWTESQFVNLCLAYLSNTKHIFSVTHSTVGWTLLLALRGFGDKGTITRLTLQEILAAGVVAVQRHDEENGCEPIVKRDSESQGVVSSAASHDQREALPQGF